MFNNQIIAGSSGQGGGSFYDYSIDYSLRLSDISGSYLYQTENFATDNTWTFSCWIKRNLLKDQAGGADQDILHVNNNDPWESFRWVGGDDSLSFSSFGRGGTTYVVNMYTYAFFRDPSAWYHVMFVYDATNGTADDRQRIYVNGERMSVQGGRYGSGAGSGNTSTTSNSALGAGYQIEIGGRDGNDPDADFQIAEVHFLDGYALTPTSFGETNNGVWVPIEYTGSYGTGGSYLNFADSSDLGKDVSGQGNHWTSGSAISAHDQLPDTPTNNFATWNVLQPTGAASGVMTLSEGNMKATGGSSIYRQVMGNMSVLSGKWYTELYITDAGYPSWTFGWTKATRYEAYTGAGTESTHHASIGYFTGANLYITDFGSASVATRTLSYSSNGSPTTGSIIGCAADFDNGKLWWSVNGTWVDIGSGAGDPANDTNPASTYTVSTYADDFKTPHFLNYNGSAVLNTGQDSTFAGNTTAGGNSDENGYGDFKYSVPSGFLAMCSANLDEPAIGPNSTTTSDEHFNTVLYTGDGTSSRGVTGVNFAPDWVVLKKRNGTGAHFVYDTIRGATNGIHTNLTDAETTYTDGLLSFDSDGFTVGSRSNHNGSGDSFVSWNWKAGGTAVSNSDGSITSSVSANTDAGFSIVSYTGTGANATIGHGLSSAPELIIIKRRDNGSGATSWKTGSDYLSGWTHRVKLNSTDAEAAEADVFNDTAPTNTVFSLGSDVTINGSGGTLIAYCFHSSDVCKVGSYVGNANADGTFVYTGFRPAFLLTKMSTNGSQWTIIDNTRNTYNAVDKGLVANTSAAEVTGSSTATPFVDFVSNGFKIRSSQAQMNQNGDTFIYLAFAESPFKYANAR